MNEYINSEYIHLSEALNLLISFTNFDLLFRWGGNILKGIKWMNANVLQVVNKLG